MLKCEHLYEYNLRRLGKSLFEARPRRHTLEP